VAEDVEVTADRVVFPPVGRRLRLTAAVVLVVGGLVQAVAGALATTWVLVAAGSIAVAFGASIARSGGRGTTVTEAGWVDPTRVRNQELPWAEVAKVRVTAAGGRATVTLERRRLERDPGLRVARLPVGAVAAVLDVIRPWAATADVEVVDLTTRRG
jgi:hypothetical protein